MQEVTLISALLYGMLSFLSPCVLPLVPPSLAYLAGNSIKELTAEQVDRRLARRVIATALCFVLGFSTVFVSLGAAVPLLGDLVVGYQDEFMFVAGAVIFIMGLHFLGLLRIDLLLREARFDVKNKPAGLLGSYVMGFAFAFGWSPCAGPMLGAILFMAGSQSDSLLGAFYLAVYSLGIGIPFMLAAIFLPAFLRFLTKFRRHIGKVEKAMGILLLLTGILFMTGFMPKLGFYLLDWFPSLGKLS